MPYMPDMPAVGGTHKPATPTVRGAMAPGLAVASIGQDIIGAGEAGFEIAQKLKQSRDLGAMHDARAKTQQAVAAHEEYRAAHPFEEDKWADDLSSRLDKTSAEILNSPGISTEFRQKFQQDSAVWKESYLTKARTDALTKRHARDRTSGLKTANQLKRAGRYDEARQVHEEGRGILWSNEEVDADLIDIDFTQQEDGKRATAEKYQLGLLDDPARGLEILSAKAEDGKYLNEPEMEEGTRARLLVMAERELDSKQTEEFEIFQGAIASGSATEEEIRKSPLYLSDGQKDSLLDHYRRTQPPSDADDDKAWNLITGIRTKYNEAKSGNVSEVDFRKAHSAARTEILKLVPNGYSGTLLETLQRYSPAGVYDRPAPKVPGAAERKADIRVEIRGSLDAAEKMNFLGPAGEDTTPVEREATARRKRDLERRAVEWSQSQKEPPSIPDVRSYTDGLISNIRSGKNAGDLRQFVPGGGQRFQHPPSFQTMPPLPAPIGKDKAAKDEFQVAPGPAGSSADLLPPKPTTPQDQLNDFLK